jgi:hypothetical protein
MSLFNFGRKDYAVPPKEVFDDAYAATYHTPDVWNLCRRMQHNIFVYDETMYGMPQHSLIETEAVRRAAAFTSKPFCLWKKKLGKASFPILLNPNGQEHESWRPARVKGVIYSVFTNTLIRLDNYKKNGVQFERKRIEVTVPNRRITVPKGKEVRGNQWDGVPVGFDRVPVYVYVGINRFWDDQLDGGYTFSPVKLYTPNDGRAPFYFFTTQEFEDV